jgi:hypothetical protein
LVVALLSDENHSVAVPDEVTGGMDELAGKILMDEQPVHRSSPI